MSYDHLLAKSIPEDQSDDLNAHLISHLKYTYWAAKSIWSNIGEDLLNALGIDPATEGERFKRIFFLAAASHDLGKANSLFQKVVRGESGVRQSIRHEWLLYVLLRCSPLEEWFRSAFKSDVEYTYFIWAIIAHHRKNSDKGTLDYSGMKLFVDNDEFRKILNWIAGEFNLKPPKPSSAEEWKKLSAKLERHSTTLKSDLLDIAIDKDFDFFQDEYDGFKLTEKSFMGAIRSLLMAADVVASAIADPDFPLRKAPFDEGAISDWITEHLTDVIPTFPKYNEIVKGRERRINANKVAQDINQQINEARAEFQDNVASSDCRVTLVSAGCGSGKTLAAFRWAVNHCAEKGNRLFFCYPTTGTATEGFLDYLLDDQDQALGDLIHSRVSVDFILNKRMRGIEKAEEGEETRASIIRSLNLWGTGIVCCTVDTVLGFLVNHYSGHLSLPAFASSIFVFDEIHSYDDTLFSYLLSFLQTFRGIPILLMTASLPNHRLEQIRDTIQNLGETLNEINGPEAWEQIKRYQQIETDSGEDPVDEVIHHYQKGEKILWVCNTVSRAICFAKQIESKAPDYNLVVYHSHFKYIDRCKKHEKTIEAFKGGNPVICITTQVAEMSLDISADYLVTDLAPTPSLIQRLGRLNRRAESDGTRPFLVLRPKDNKEEPFFLPYEDNGWWSESEEWLRELGGNELSQKDLIVAWEKTVTKERRKSAPGTSPWAKAMDHEPKPLRKLAAGSCEVILEEDIAEIKRGGKTSFLKCAIPMTAPKSIKKPIINHKYGCIVVKNGEEIFYDREVGAFWIKPEDKSKSAPDGIEGPLIV